MEFEGLPHAGARKTLGGQVRADRESTRSCRRTVAAGHALRCAPIDRAAGRRAGRHRRAAASRRATRRCGAALAPKAAIRTTVPSAFYAFDLLQWEDYDLRALPLDGPQGRVARHRARAQAGVLFVDHVTPKTATPLLQAIADRRAAGGDRQTRRRRPYVSRSASDDWLRVSADAPTTADSVDEPTDARSRRRRRRRRHRASRRPISTRSTGRPRATRRATSMAYYAPHRRRACFPTCTTRPVHFNRFPDGIEGKSFYQREVKEGTPDWVGRAAVPHDGELGPAPRHRRPRQRCCTRPTSAASTCIPGCRASAPSSNPTTRSSTSTRKRHRGTHVVRIARACRPPAARHRPAAAAEDIGQNRHARLRAAAGAATAYEHSQDVLRSRGAGAGARAARHRDRGAARRNNRDGKVYVDFLQNRKSQTIVPPYSARPVRLGVGVGAARCGTNSKTPR